MNGAVDSPPPDISTGMTLLLATACGIVVAGLYFAQPLTPLIGPDLGMRPAAAGLVVTLTQLGYGAGLVLLAPLADVVENRRLVIGTLCCNIVVLLLIAASAGPVMFLVASAALGLSSAVVQVLVPFSAHLARPETRGRVVGNVVSGLLIGILLGRPAASLVAALFGWRWVFAGSAVVTTLLVAVLIRALPSRRPTTRTRYPALLASMVMLWRTEPELRRRAAQQSGLFAAFSLFWTAIPLRLAHEYGLGQYGIALFALAGAGGAIAAPLAGRAADRGWTRQASWIAVLLSAAAFAATALDVGLVVLALCAVLLDAGVQTNLVVSQRALYQLPAELRGRLNSVFIGTFFVGGAIGSALAGVLFAYGWNAVALVGTLLPLLTLQTLLGRRAD